MTGHRKCQVELALAAVLTFLGTHREFQMQEEQPAATANNDCLPWLLPITKGERERERQREGEREGGRERRETEMEKERGREGESSGCSPTLIRPLCQSRAILAVTPEPHGDLSTCPGHARRERKLSHGYQRENELCYEKEWKWSFGDLRGEKDSHHLFQCNSPNKSS